MSDLLPRVRAGCKRRSVRNPQTFALAGRPPIPATPHSDPSASRAMQGSVPEFHKVRREVPGAVPTTARLAISHRPLILQTMSDKW